MTKKCNGKYEVPSENIFDAVAKVFSWKKLLESRSTSHACWLLLQCCSIHMSMSRSYSIPDHLSGSFVVVQKGRAIIDAGGWGGSFRASWSKSIRPSYPQNEKMHDPRPLVYIIFNCLAYLQFNYNIWQTTPKSLGNKEIWIKSVARKIIWSNV